MYQQVQRPMRRSQVDLETRTRVVGGKVTEATRTKSWRSCSEDEDFGFCSLGVKQLG